MSFRAFRSRCYLQCTERRSRPFWHKHYATIKSGASTERSRVTGSKTKWYGVSAIATSMVGLWAWNATNSRQLALRPLSTEYFTPTVLTSSERTGDNTKLLRLTIPPEVVSKLSKSDFQPIWSVYVKDSDIQVERPYTPLEGLSPDGEMIFWVKKYEHGEVGRWLLNKSPGDKVEIRGPDQTWSWQDGSWDNVIMVAGGTGITPFFQLLHERFSDPARSTNTRFTLLQSYRSPKELPPPRILDSLSSWESSNAQNLKIHTFVDDMDGEPTRGNLSVGRISKDALNSALNASSGRTIVLICGPDPMVHALAGPKGRDQSQGPLGGALGALYDGKFHVWKL